MVVMVVVGDISVWGVKGSPTKNIGEEWFSGNCCQWEIIMRSKIRSFIFLKTRYWSW